MYWFIYTKVQKYQCSWELRKYKEIKQSLWPLFKLAH
jgi:hypothetical protein